MYTQWGAALADAIEDAFPNVAAAVRHGLAHDCSDFISTLRDNPNTATSQVGAMCHAVEVAMNHIINRNAELEIQITNLNNELSDLQKRYITTTERLTKNQLNNRPTGDRPRRTTTDPKPFSGEEKDVAKRQTEYVNWRSHLVRAFSVDESTFTDEFIRLQHIAGLLEGTAYRLYRKKFDHIIDHRDNPSAWHWSTYKECLTELNKQYETLVADSVPSF